MPPTSLLAFCLWLDVALPAPAPAPASPVPGAAVALAAAATPARRPPRKGPAVGDERLVFQVTMRGFQGALVVGLYDAIAPKHAAQLRKLVRLGVYDGAPIFRVEPGFVAQVVNAQNRGKPLTSEQRKAIVPIPAEFSKLPHRTGTVSMARDDDDPNSAETSFSFVLGRSPHLDRQYTVVGEVEYGQRLLTLIAKEPRNSENRPTHPVVIDRAEVKTAAEVAELRASGQLRDLRPLPPAPR